MKYIISASVLFVTTLFFVGCSNEKETEIDETREEVKFSTNMYLSEEAEPTTRANLSFDENTTLKLVVRDNNSTPYFSQITETALTGAPSGTSNTLALTNKLYWDDLGGKSANLKIIGICPPTAILSGDGIAWTASADQQAGVEDYDLMTALIGEYKHTDRSAPAELDFKHALTKVTINLTSTDFSLPDLDDASVVFNVSNSAIYNVLTSTFSNAVAKTAVKPLKTNYVVKGADEQDVLKGYSFTILTIPFTAGDNLATIVINGNEYYINATSRELKSGIHTNYNVSVSKVGIQVKASITDWETPAGIAIENRIVGLGEFVISDTGNIKLTEGSIIKMDITDGSDEVHRTAFEYKKDGDKYYWIATTPVYWDDINYPAKGIKALLKLGGITIGGITTGEAYFVGEATGSYDIQSAIPLGNTFFKHPLSKISVIIKTTPTGTDMVNLKGIQQVYIPGCGTFKLDNIDDLKIIKDESGNQTITGAMNAAETEYICIPGFIFPQTLENANDGGLCHVTIKENEQNTNVYKVKFNEATKAFIAGTHYTFTVTIKKSGINITAGITDWEKEFINDINSGLD